MEVLEWAAKIIREANVVIQNLNANPSSPEYGKRINELEEKVKKNLAALLYWERK